jgi:hypothetical protein
VAGSASSVTDDSFIRFSAADAVNGHIISGDETNHRTTDGVSAEVCHVYSKVSEGVPSVSFPLSELAVRDSEVQASADEQHDTDSEALAAIPAVLIQVNGSVVAEDLLGTSGDDAGESTINSVIGLVLDRLANNVAALSCFTWRSIIFTDDDSWWGYYMLAIGLYIVKMFVFPPSAGQPFKNESLKEAVKMWCENKSAAAAKFGDISHGTLLR